MIALWRLPEVSRRTGLARSTIYKYIAAGLFPAPVRLTSACVGWRAEQVEAWILARPVAETVRGPHQQRVGADVP